ncbi:transcriptional regulator GutM [Enterococcus sp. BWB1-3]|uniref:transcriptional regulator GutM n=1 Tax=unclassified Enterococcus TaxID=2608891 RepID=UPI001920B916|nr:MULTISPECIES: transcriptional regulator GutM [unclassified Enterococcus]MBL1229702.1 transcriptional regulator GutM [Enterococcus sp. BWB1-3]MCB5952838.1 transcriptional regulator GutM [Enterococcus sp. BWT-B8]MCB5953843.1 transcriptional regulator GutM [Enterococcus sp. CWB-B31]
MNILFLGVIAIMAYAIQMILGLKQIKNFNTVYSRMRRKGKVAIGRRPGKIVSGTILLLAVASDGKITKAEMMQGTSILARFKERPQFVGLNIHELSENHPLLLKENKLTRQAALNAKGIYLDVEKGEFQERQSVSPVMNLGIQLSIVKNSVQTAFTERKSCFVFRRKKE